MESRLPKTLSVSMALHIAGVGVWLYISQLSKTGQTRVLSNVELMIAPRPAPISVGQAPASQPSTWNFLKMALPSAPARVPIDVETPKQEVRPKLGQDRLLNENQEKFKKRLELEADKETAHRNLQALDTATAHVSHNRLAQVSRLEEVGARQASKSAIAMDDALIEAGGHHGAAAPQDLSALADAAPAASHASSAPMATLSEAAPAGRSKESASSLASLLPSDEGFSHGRTGPMSAGGGMEEAAPAPAHAKVEAISEKKKTAMIEGPLKDRRVTHYEIPKFPKWLQAQGVLEAIVRIRFSVDPSGQVLDEMRLVQTSGYADLDRLAMGSLQQWQFEPKSEDSGNEWGIITFRFVVE